MTSSLIFLSLITLAGVWVSRTGKKERAQTLGKFALRKHECPEGHQIVGAGSMFRVGDELWCFDCGRYYFRDECR